MSMNLNLCQKPPLHKYLLSSFYFEKNLHLVPHFFIFVNYFQCNLTSSWHCLLRRLAWLLGLLHNWRQSIQLETRKSSKSRWNIRSRQSRWQRGIRFIPKPRLIWTYPSTSWYPCQLWGQPSKLMCSRWNKCSKWAIEKVTKFYMSLP